MNSNMKVTHEPMMLKKCKTKLRIMMMTMVDSMIMVMMMIMMMMVMLKLKMMMMIMMVMVVIVVIMKIILLIGKTSWCILKHKTLQIGEEVTLHSVQQHQNRPIAQFYTKQQFYDLITFNGISTQFSKIHKGGAILQTSWQCTHSLHTLTVRRNDVDGW